MFFLKKRTTKNEWLFFLKNNYKNQRGWGGRGNLGFPTLKKNIFKRRYI